jgi:7,8-dihydropterin-6-yl-methyl-4-(beta-D-ribofuranosyl)aminobenzene 5'-phosphate synthase
MHIVTLMENTPGAPGCAYEHGLSFYAETAHHKILLDTGASDAFMKNAELLGIDLSQVDTVILSHGHYDHSGGIIPFSGINSSAVIYMQKNAPGDFYSQSGDEYRYIGIDREISKLSQVRFIDGDHVIDDELSLFVIERRVTEVPFTNMRLKVKTSAGYARDAFSHEQALVVTDGGKNILLSGCAHNGIINILEEYRRKYGAEPDAAISGFHLAKKGEYSEKELEEIADIAQKLKKHHTKFYTCHCTGLDAYDTMKGIMGEQLEYVHTGDELFF